MEDNLASNKLMKKLLILVFSTSLLWSTASFAKTINNYNFVYELVYECSEEKFDVFETPSMEMYKIFFIHFDVNDNVVILNDNTIYKSFEETIIPNLYYKNGGVFSLSFTKNGDQYLFILKDDTRKFIDHDPDIYHSTTLIFDRSNLTYTWRTVSKNNQNEVIKTFLPSTGLCFRESI